MRDPVARNTTGNLDYYEGVLDSVRVATWDDGISFWRTGLTRYGDDRHQVFRFRSAVTRNEVYRNDRLWSPDGVEYAVMRSNILGRVVGASESIPEDAGHPVGGGGLGGGRGPAREGALLAGGRVVLVDQVNAHLRWVLAKLSLITVGATPLPTSLFPHEEDPYVGRFQAATFEEALRDADEVDRKIEKLSSSGSGTGSCFVGSDLFAPGTKATVEWKNDRKIRSLVVQDVGGTRNRRRERDVDHVFELDLRWLSSFVEKMQSLYGSPSDARPPLTSARWRTSWPTRSTTRSFMVLPQEDADRWWAENTESGRLSLPEDEVGLFSLLGENLPYLWDDDHLRQWATDRWGST